MTTIEQLRSLRESLPKGNKDPFASDKSKRVLLQRLLRKDNIAELTSGELTVLNEWLVFLKEVKKANKEFEKEIQKLAQQ